MIIKLAKDTKPYYIPVSPTQYDIILGLGYDEIFEYLRTFLTLKLTSYETLSQYDMTITQVNYQRLCDRLKVTLYIPQTNQILCVYISSFSPIRRTN